MTTITIDEIVAKAEARLHQRASLPPPGSERLVRFGNEGAYEVLGETQPWWQTFALHEPELGAIIEMTSEGPRPIDGPSALDRLQTYEFGRGAYLEFIEKPLNNLVRQFPYTGSILVGGLPALFLAQGVDGVVEGTSLTASQQMWTKIGAKVALGVGVPVLVGDRVMSRSGQLVFGGIMLASAALDVDVLRKWISNGVIFLRNLFRSDADKIPFQQSSGLLTNHAQTDTSHMLGDGRWGQEHGIGDVRHRQEPPGIGGLGPHPLSGARGF